MELARIRPTWVEVDLDRIKHNVAELRRAAPGAELMAVVKADGYGHGAVPVAEVALEAGASWLGVATLEEGVDLRKAGLTAPVLIFGYIPAAQADSVVLYDLRPTLFHMDLAQALNQWARALMRTVPVHIKVDTGMSRVGIQPADAVAFAHAVSELPNLEVEGLLTHLACADEPDNPFTAEQIRRFDDLQAALRDAAIQPKLRHAANSAGTLLHPAAHYDIVRAGIALYGLPPDPVVKWPADLRPALSFRSRVALVKEIAPNTPVSYGSTYRATGAERVATLPVGYADGYFRLLSGRSRVLIGGRSCPVVGRVCMDQLVVRVPDDLAVAVDDEAVLIGEQGSESISASELAGLVGSINYEIVCAISKRVPRVYRKDGELQK